MTATILDEPTKTFKAPDVYRGQIVLFRQSPTEEKAIPAVVLEVYERGLIDVHAFVRGIQIPQEYEGVRHITDPRKPEDQRWVWEHTDEWKLFSKLRDVVKGLQEAVASRK